MIDMEAQRMQHVLEQDHDDMDDDDPNESHIDAAKPIRDLSPHSDEILVGDGGTSQRFFSSSFQELCGR
ncbi:hypothetical protein V6N13_024778 [Hibiscus sabdariffa]